jgi:hypothetical protein
MAANAPVAANIGPSAGQISETTANAGTIRTWPGACLIPNCPMTKSRSHLVDRIAMLIAGACGIHCICFPFLLAMTAASGLVHFVSRPLEIGFVASAFVLGVANLTSSWRRNHHRPECLVLFLTGITLIAVHEFVAQAAASAAISVAGGVLIGSAHFRNIQLLRRSGCAGHQPGPGLSSGEAASAPSSE